MIRRIYYLFCDYEWPALSDPSHMLKCHQRFDGKYGENGTALRNRADGWSRQRNGRQPVDFCPIHTKIFNVKGFPSHWKPGGKG